MMSRSAAALVMLSLLAGPAAHADAAAGTLTALAARRPLRVGMHAGMAPFVVAGAEAGEMRRLLGERAPPLRAARDGRSLCGLDVELVAEAARLLGVPLEITLVERFEDLLPGLRRGDYDVVLSGLTRTLDRALTVSFTDAYFTSGLEVLARDPARFPSLDSLRRPDVRIAVHTGTTDESFARQRLAGATIVALPDDAGVFRAMDDPRIDAVVIDAVSARDAVVRGRAKASLGRVEGRRFTAERFAMAVRQGDPEWLGWLNLFLEEMKSSGAFHRLAARFNPWFRIEQ